MVSWENNLLPTHASAKVICRFDRLRTAHSKRQQAIWVLKNLLATHTLDYIVFRVEPDLSSFEYLAMALHIPLYFATETAKCSQTHEVCYPLQSEVTQKSFPIDSALCDGC